MTIYKVHHPDATNIALHGKEFDVVGGFIEVPDDEITPELETTLTKGLGFEIATAADVDAAIAALDTGDKQKQDADERAALLAEIKAWGLKVDGRKNVSWLRERYQEFVEQGAIKPGETPPEAGAGEEDDDNSKEPPAP